MGAKHYLYQSSSPSNVASYIYTLSSPVKEVNTIPIIFIDNFFSYKYKKHYSLVITIPIFFIFIFIGFIDDVSKRIA